MTSLSPSCKVRVPKSFENVTICKLCKGNNPTCQLCCYRGKLALKPNQPVARLPVGNEHAKSVFRKFFVGESLPFLAYMGGEEASLKSPYRALLWQSLFVIVLGMTGIVIKEFLGEVESVNDAINKLKSMEPAKVTCFMSIAMLLLLLAREVYYCFPADTKEYVDDMLVEETPPSGEKAKEQITKEITDLSESAKSVSAMLQDEVSECTPIGTPIQGSETSNAVEKLENQPLTACCGKAPCDCRCKELLTKCCGKKPVDCRCNVKTAKIERLTEEEIDKIEKRGNLIAATGLGEKVQADGCEWKIVEKKTRDFDVKLSFSRSEIGEEPVYKPEPVKKPEPVSEPGPVSKPEPVRESVTVSEPEPVCEPEPEKVVYQDEPEALQPPPPPPAEKSELQPSEPIREPCSWSNWPYSINECLERFVKRHPLAAIYFGIVSFLFSQLLLICCYIPWISWKNMSECIGCMNKCAIEAMQK